MSPLSNAYLSEAELEKMEPHYPLHLRICETCFLVQLEEFERPEAIFTQYAYFSSYSESWLRHSRDFAERTARKFGLNENSLVVEIASNDGYLLQFFKGQGIPVLGVEPAQNVAAAAERKAIPTLARFFGAATAREMIAGGKQADLLIGNNVLAHVPALNDFVAGLKLLLKPEGIITMEFPHLLRMIQGIQFDTIYHEHFSYFSLTTVEQVFRSHELAIFDVEELSTHGGSLRIYAQHCGAGSRATCPSVTQLKSRELAEGLRDLQTYVSFRERICETKRALLEFLISVKRSGRSIVGYGAPAKANTLLNHCGIRTDFLDYTVDLSPHKQNCFCPDHISPYFIRTDFGRPSLTMC